MQHLLVIRGGAVGDFILTLPALGALRQAFPQAVIDVMGHPGRAILARHPCYADHIMDLEQWDVHRLFSPSLNVSDVLATYLKTFDVIVSYLPAPDAAFASNLRRYCPGNVITWHPHPVRGVHITNYLMQPLQRFFDQAYSPVPRVVIDADAQEAATQFWDAHHLPATGVIAFHPGSGGQHKLWPLAGWQQVMTWAAQHGLHGIIISGPAEEEHLTPLRQHPELAAWPWVRQLPLPHVAALLTRCQVMLGHDSGMTHLAAAVGTTTLALFGPTEPLMWGPRHPKTCILQPHPLGPLTLQNLPPATVIRTLTALLHRTFRFVPSRIGCTIITPA